MDKTACTEVDTWLRQSKCKRQSATSRKLRKRGKIWPHRHMPKLNQRGEDAQNRARPERVSTTISRCAPKKSSPPFAHMTSAKKAGLNAWRGNAPVGPGMTRSG